MLRAAVFVVMSAIAVVVYRPAVDAPVVQPFAAPSTPYGPGHRGVDYGTSPGQSVVAEADGVVEFAGQVAGQLWVVVAHPDGVRTSYGPLTGVSVSSGQPVAGGDVIGTAGARLHVGARVGATYVDPLTLLPPGPAPVHVRLVPDDDASGLGRSSQPVSVSGS